MLNRPQEVVVQTRLEKGITMKFLPPMIMMIQMVMIRLLIKTLGSTPITAVCSHKQHQHAGMMIK